MQSDVKSIRRENLLRLLEQRFRNDTEASRKTGINRTIISQIRAGSRDIGDRQAAQFERLLGLPERALDYPDMTPPSWADPQPQPEEPSAACESDDIAAHISRLPAEIRLPLELLVRSLTSHVRGQTATAHVAPFRLERRHGT